MTTLIENPRTGDWLLSEANGSYSRENRILVAGAHQSGTVLGKVTASDKFVVLAPAAADGSEAAAAILWAAADATDGEVAIVTFERATEAKLDGLIWPEGITAEQKTTAIAQLDELGIVLR